MDDFPDIITVDEICLRPMTAVDTRMVLKHLGEADTARWMAAVKQSFGLAEAEEILAIGQDNDRRLRVIELDGAMVGCLCLLPDLWFWMDPAFRGRGLVSRALAAAITAHFSASAPPLVATCREDNHASRAVLSSLGFSRKPRSRRMFFQSEGRSLPCLDHVMTSEQWMYLRPPVQQCGAVSLRPATQKDAPTLTLMLPGREHSAGWPGPEALNRFIERHRCRVPDRGLFVVEDGNRRVVGMVLRHGTGERALRFLTPEDSTRYARDLTMALPGTCV